MKEQIIQFKIIRKTSEYNKYIKWFAEKYNDDGSVLSSCGFRTQKEARESVIPRENPFPIGNRKVLIIMQEIIDKNKLKDGDTIIFETPLFLFNGSISREFIVLDKKKRLYQAPGIGFYIALSRKDFKRPYTVTRRI